MYLYIYITPLPEGVPGSSDESKVPGDRKCYVNPIGVRLTSQVYDVT